MIAPSSWGVFQVPPNLYRRQLVSPQRKRISRVAALSVVERHGRRFWLTALTVGAFFFGYYYFAEVWPALLPAG